MGFSLALEAQQPEAVCFLLHWPSGWLAPAVPDVIRHTALRSSDFPPPLDGEPREAAIVRPPALFEFSSGGEVPLAYSCSLPERIRVEGQIPFIVRGVLSGAISGGNTFQKLDCQAIAGRTFETRIGLRCGLLTRTDSG